MSRRSLAALLVLCACALDHTAPDGDGGAGSLDFNIGGIVFHVASGTARSGSTLGLYLSDQPDACLAITQLPVGSYTVLALRVVPGADGSLSATVVPKGLSPGPGQAMGDLSAMTGAVKTAGHDAHDGSVVWTANPDGTTTIVALDLGFVGTADRLTASGLTIPTCP